MPNYVGSVRTMVVACNNGAYGRADKTTPVRKPLMILATLPRVLGPGETLTLPVNVFAMEDRVKNVRLTLEETSGLVEILGAPQKEINFSSPGDEIVTFNLRVTERVGVAKFKVSAQGGSERATQEIEIDIRNPNPYIADVIDKVIQPGEEWSQDYKMPGVAGTNTASLEVSNIPPLNLQRRLRWLIRYPHGCLEQTTSAVFPQLYVGKLIEMDEKLKNKTKSNIEAAINKFRRYQTTAGGFSYWPGNRSATYWGTNYVGHFMIEAKELGYSLPPNMLERWKSYQAKVARSWNPEMDDSGYSRDRNELDQAYRLYTLALAGSPELGAMNRLREDDRLDNLAKWRLAAAYTLAGKPEVGKQIISNLSSSVKPYTEISYTYGSETRDEAMILETLVLLKENEKAAKLAKIIAEKISSERWYGTHTIAYSLLALGKFVGNSQVGGPLEYAYQTKGEQVINAGSSKSIDIKDLPVDQPSKQGVLVKNATQKILYARVVLSGQPLIGDQTSAENDLQLKVSYKSLDGKSLDVSRIEQGTDFIAEVSITNPGTRLNWYRDMTLNQVFPSGWEITNTRMSNAERFKQTSYPNYQDIRDDRVYTYYDIGRNKTEVFRVQLNAAYQGRFYLPSLVSEAMYDNTISARKPGQWVEVVGGSEI